jgi:hypothetical protein
VVVVSRWIGVECEIVRSRMIAACVVVVSRWIGVECEIVRSRMIAAGVAVVSRWIDPGCAMIVGVGNRMNSLDRRCGIGVGRMMISEAIRCD